MRLHRPHLVPVGKPIEFQRPTSTPSSHKIAIKIAIKRHRPPLANLQHSAIHMAIVLLDKHPATALPVAQQILSTFPRDHPALPLLETRVHQLTHEQPPARGPEHLPEELRAMMIAELIDEDQLPKKKKSAKRK
jgi:hypothetical protein